MRWLVVVVLLAGGVAAAEPVHSCIDCHNSHLAPPSTAPHALFRVAGVCAGCHRNESEAHRNHGAGVPVRAAATLPLTEGMVACTTCHDPHGKAALMLRRPADALCADCH